MKEISYKTCYGDVHFGNSWEIEKPKAVVVIVTGMCEHSSRYDDFAKFLNKHDYSVFCLDHSGQGEGKNGPLGHPYKDYFTKFEKIIDDYILVLKDKYNLPIYIFSHSMGSFVTQGYIENYHNADKVVICGSNYIGGLGKLGNAVATMIVHKGNYEKDAGLLDQMAVGGYDKAYKKEGHNAWLSYNEENRKKYNADKYCGYKCSNGFYREFFKGMASLNKKDKLAAINKSLPILIICGDGDPVGSNGKGPTKLNELYHKYGLNSRVIVYPHMRHEILNEDKHMDVYNDIAQFYKK